MTFSLMEEDRIGLIALSVSLPSCITKVLKGILSCYVARGNSGIVWKVRFIAVRKRKSVKRPLLFSSSSFWIARQIGIISRFRNLSPTQLFAKISKDIL